MRRLTSPLEEPLPLPTEWVEGGDAGGRKGKIVGEEDGDVQRAASKKRTLRRRSGSSCRDPGKAKRPV